MVKGVDRPARVDTRKPMRGMMVYCSRVPSATLPGELTTSWKSCTAHVSTVLRKEKHLPASDAQQANVLTAVMDSTARRCPEALMFSGCRSCMKGRPAGQLGTYRLPLGSVYRNLCTGEQGQQVADPWPSTGMHCLILAVATLGSKLRAILLCCCITRNQVHQGASYCNPWKFSFLCYQLQLSFDRFESLRNFRHSQALFQVSGTGAVC